MTRTFLRALILVSLWALISSLHHPRELQAQTAHPYSVQVSGILTVLTGNYEAGPDSEIGDRYVNFGAGAGLEVQVQRRMGVSSLGFGFQYTRHAGSVEDEGGSKVRDLDGDVTVFGVFLEPRWPILALSTEDAAPYLAGRAGISRVRQSGEVDVEATGYTLNGGGGVLFRLNRQATLDLGVTLGLRNFGEELGSFGNALLRVGVFIGIPSGGSGS